MGGIDSPGADDLTGLWFGMRSLEKKLSPEDCPLSARSGSRKCIVHRSLIDCGQIRTLKLIGPVNEDACIPSFGLLLSVKRNVFHNDSSQVQITSKCNLQAHQFSEGITFIYVKRLT